MFAAEMVWSVIIFDMTETMSVGVSPDLETINFISERDDAVSYFRIIPEDHHTSLCTPEPLAEDGAFRRLISPNGTFKFYIPTRPAISHDWALYLQGYPRIANHIKYDVVEELMGEEVVLVLQALAANVHNVRESVGDVLAKERTRGPVPAERLHEVLAENTMHIFETPDLNQRTKGRRAALLAHAPYDRLKTTYTVRRSLLIADEPTA